VQALKDAVRIVKENARAYVTMNLVYYGLTFGAMLFVLVYPAVQEQLLETVRKSFQHGFMKPVASAYQGGHVFAAILLTFVVNLLGGSLLTITLPSLVVPFSGLTMGVLRATLWGLLLSPGNERLGWAMLPHSLTLLLEGQAYVLTMLAAYVQGKCFVLPRSMGATTCGQGYAAGVRLSVKIYRLVVLFLAVSAVYEALEVIYVVPLLTGWH